MTGRTDNDQLQQASAPEVAVAHYDEADLLQELQADYRIMNIPGRHYAIGRWLGERTPLRTIPHRGPGEPDPAFAWACLQTVRRFHPDIEAEFEGFAAAKGVPLEALTSHIALHVTNGNVGQCSSIGYRSPGGRVIVGRNYDFRYRQRLRYLIHTAPPGYAAHVGTNSGLVGGRYDGVNEYGVFVSLHTIMAERPETVSPGIPFHLVVRIVLETSDSARRAMETIRHMPMLHSFSYFVADAAEMYSVECHPEAVQVVGGRAHLLAVTNHYQHPALQRLHGPRKLRHSRERLRYLLSAPSQWDGDADPVLETQRLMSQHTVPLCGHQDGAATLWSVVCEPAAQRVSYSLGAPCRNPYQEIPWPGQAWAGWGTAPLDD